MRTPALNPSPYETTALLGYPTSPAIGRRGLEPAGFLDDLLREVIPGVRRVAPVACSACTAIPDPSLRAACQATCAVIG